MIKTQQPVPDPIPQNNNNKQPDRQNYLQNYNIFRLILIISRLTVAGAIMCFVILFQEYVRPRIMIPSVRRYLSCIVNLLCLRLVLFLFGIFYFQPSNYTYFQRNQKKVTFRSGWVGVAPRQTIIEFIYFSYIFNPTYVRMIQHHYYDSSTNSKKIKLLYTPLSFKQAFFASFDPRGFDPIVLTGEIQLKNFKRRKMLMPTLISQCFQQLNGPILIFLPGVKIRQQYKMHKILGEDIYQNQRRFLRSGIVFTSHFQQFQNKIQRKIADFSERSYINQLYLLVDVCSELKFNYLNVNATETIKNKYQYNSSTYSQFVDDIFKKNSFIITNGTFSEYKEKILSYNIQINQHQDEEIIKKIIPTINIQVQEQKNQIYTSLVQIQDNQAVLGDIDKFD